MQRSPALSSQSSLANEVAKARQHIKNSLECMNKVTALPVVPNTELISKIDTLEKSNKDLISLVGDLKKLVASLLSRVQDLESKSVGSSTNATAAKVFSLKSLF